MRCRSCGAEVREGDRFCNACGARLVPDTDDRVEAATPGTDDAPGIDDDALVVDQDAPGIEDDAPWVEEEALGVEEDAPGVEDDTATDDDTGLTSQPGEPAAGEVEGRDQTNEMPLPDLYDLADEIDPDVADTLASMARDEPPDPGRTTVMPGVAPPPPDDRTTVLPGHAPSPAVPPPPPGEMTTVMRGTPAPEPTSQVPVGYAPVIPRDAGPAGDELDHRRFRFRTVLLVAILAAVAAAASAGATIIEITSNDPAQTFPIGTWALNDFGTNNTVGMAIGVAVMLIGAALACFRYRWGGGLAGGAGLAITGWSALMIAIAELQFAPARARIGQAPEGLEVTFTRDVGYWLLVAAGVLGVLVFLTSLTSIRRDAATNLNPWVAALGAAAALVAAAGPLIPEGNATIEHNWSSVDGVLDLPTAFFAGRLAQLAILAFTGLVGFLLMRRYGLGLAAGGFTIVSWLAFTALLEQTANPIGPARENPGAVDTVPHAVTIGGIAAALLCLVIAALEVALQARPDE